MPDKTDIVERLEAKQELAKLNVRYGVLPDDLYGKAATLIEQQAATILDLRERLAKLASTEAEYRQIHDLHGDGNIHTGRAWDRMRRAGDAARAYFAALEPKP